MALGWGDNTWGEYGYGGAIPISGNQADAAVGTASPVVLIALTGVSASGAMRVCSAKLACCGLESTRAAKREVGISTVP